MGQVMKKYVNFYSCSQNDGTPNDWHIYSEAYDSEEKARGIYEDAADHHWLKYKAVAIPVEFSVDDGLRK